MTCLAETSRYYQQLTTDPDPDHGREHAAADAAADAVGDVAENMMRAYHETNVQCAAIGTATELKHGLAAVADPETKNGGIAKRGSRRETFEIVGNAAVAAIAVVVDAIVHDDAAAAAAAAGDVDDAEAGMKVPKLEKLQVAGWPTWG